MKLTKIRINLIKFFYELMSKYLAISEPREKSNNISFGPNNLINYKNLISI